jgi:predicted transcriptional regulator
MEGRMGRATKLGRKPINVKKDRVVTTRLDQKTREALSRLARALGKSESEIVREGIKMLSESNVSKGIQGIAFHGLGQFASGITDLGSNKKHLRGFGR